MNFPLATIVLLAVAAAGCARVSAPDDVVCTAQFVYGLSVTVQSEDSGQRICDAEVVALDGSYRETLTSFGPPESCTYSGAGERPGVYELRASRPEFRLATIANLRVGADECHVIPVGVAIALGR